MTFIDILRKARQSRVAVLHEFWAQYDPQQKRIHAFFEGHDDVVFFRERITQRMPEGYRLVTYRCEGKPRVFEAYAEITRRQPNAQLVLFFVDKDLDDILGTPWPTDPRIFVTDTYSIENYCVDAKVLLQAYRDAVRVVGVSFDEAVLASQFERSLGSFYRRLLSTMAWILVARRSGQKPNLGNIDMGALWTLSPSFNLRSRAYDRNTALSKATGVSLLPGSSALLRAAARELARLKPKRIVRGKFELWFMVEFWRLLVEQLRTLAKEGGGNIQVQLDLSHARAVVLLAKYVATPPSLERFLSAHFASQTNQAARREASKRGGRWSWITRWLPGRARP